MKSVGKIRGVIIAFGFAVVLLMPAAGDAGPILDWLCGALPAAPAAVPVAQTTYTQPYYAADSSAPVYAAQSSNCGCTQQVVQYAPYTSYRPVLSRPVTTFYYPTAAYYPASSCSSCSAPTTTYYPAATCNSCSAPTTTYYPATACNSCAAPVAAYYPSATTVYRPVGLFTQQVRLIPYTTYRMAYMPVTSIAYAPGASCASPCASACGSPCVSSCGSSCSPACDSCGGAGCATPTTYESSESGMAQPAISGGGVVSSAPAARAPGSNSSEGNSSDYGRQKTFREDQRPADESKPSIPDNNNSSPGNKPATAPNSGSNPQPESRLNSSPGPQLGNPENRSTSAPVRQAIYLVNRPTLPAAPPAAEINAGWRESRD
jgi:hypothetical protein